MAYNNYFLGLSIAATIILINLASIIGLVGFLITNPLESSMATNKTNTLQLKIEDKESLKQEVTAEKDDAQGIWLCKIILLQCIIMIFITNLLILWNIKHRPILKFPILSASCFALFSCIMRNLAFVSVIPFFGITLSDQLYVFSFATLELCFEVPLIWLITTLRTERIPRRTDPNRIVIEIDGEAYNYVKENVVQQIKYLDNNVNQKSAKL